jgi:hypothetical protein
MLTAMTLALAMIAGDAMAQFDVSVSANTNAMRHLKVSRNDVEPGAGKIQMVFWIYPDFELDQPGMAPVLLGSDYNLNVDAPYLGMSIYYPDSNLATASRQIYALYVSVGNERRRVHSFNVELANFGTFDGHYQTKGYLGDPDEPDQQFWHDRAMSEELTVEIVRENLNGSGAELLLKGTIPPVD